MADRLLTNHSQDPRDPTTHITTHKYSLNNRGCSQKLRTIMAVPILRLHTPSLRLARHPTQGTTQTTLGVRERVHTLPDGVRFCGSVDKAKQPEAVAAVQVFCKITRAIPPPSSMTNPIAARMSAACQVRKCFRCSRCHSRASSTTILMMARRIHAPPPPADRIGFCNPY